MTINLSEYVGKVITYVNRENEIITGEVSLNYVNDNFPYVINKFHFDEVGHGFTAPSILSVIVNGSIPFATVKLDGIAHQAPNINLKDFVGQTVMIKTRQNQFHIAELNYNGSSYNIGELSSYTKAGHSFYDGDCDIVEIYGQGAYEFQTKSTFTEPEDPKLKQAKELLNELTEEQIAKLLKSLTS
jgi:hypothetical protein